jgi:hypothetical protein
MSGSVTITVDFPDCKLTERAKNRVRRKAGMHAATWLRDHAYPPRFRVKNGGNKFGFAPRSEKYMRRTALYGQGTLKRRFGPASFHHFSGKTERMFRRAKLYGAKQSFGFRVDRYELQNKGYGRRRAAGAIDLWAEIRAILPAELRTMLGLYGRKFQEILMQEIARTGKRRRL